LEGSGTIPILVWRNWGKPRHVSVGAADFPAEIRSRHLPNTTPKRSHVPLVWKVKPCYKMVVGSQNRSVSTMKGYGLDGQGSIPGRGKRSFSIP
jgi:hypothetical protein